MKMHVVQIHASRFAVRLNESRRPVWYMYVLNSLIPNCAILYVNLKPCTMMYTLKFGRIATNRKTRTICMELSFL